MRNAINPFGLAPLELEMAYINCQKVPIAKMASSELTHEEFLEWKKLGFTRRTFLGYSGRQVYFLMTYQKWLSLKYGSSNTFNFLRGYNSGDRWAMIDGEAHRVITLV